MLGRNTNLRTTETMKNV